MNKGVIRLNQYATKENTIESFVCFRKFIEFLERKVQTANGSSNHFYQYVLDKIKLFPQLSQYVNINEIENYDEILDLVASIVFPLTDDEDEVLMALTNAASPEAFYATNAFSRLFQFMFAKDIPQPWLDKNAILEIHKQFQYNLALEKIYGAALPERKEVIYSFLHPHTHLYKYYRLSFDTRFVEVKAKQGMEKISNQQINSCIICSNPLEKIEQLLSLDQYTASGFSILTLTDITAQQAIEQIGKALVDINPDNTESSFLHISRLLQTIIGSSEYRFGIMPFFTINKRAALPYENFSYSILVEASVKANIPRKIFNRYMNHYIKNPGLIIYQAPDDKTLPVRLGNALKAAGINYYALAPVFFNNQLVGILEIGAAKNVTPLNEFQVSKLKPAMPYISQLMKLLIEKFNTSIDKIIKEKFTNIQQSVQWKFNEVAWHYFRSHQIEHKDSALEKVFFKEVYPLYGAVDIRNSTIERNIALREDLEFQLQSVISLLTSLYENGLGDQYLTLADSCLQWLEKMKAHVSVEEELGLNDFLYSQVHPVLSSFDELPGDLSTKIEAYFKSLSETTGQAFEKRRQLENSMDTLNAAIGKYFDLFKDELQVNYPCYFEKFRTDGTEYDIYIGQSIAPSIPFSLAHLDNLRLWQVQSMAAITKLTHDMQPHLEHPLQTTQLIFVNARAIDISFRIDERRFDVEGAYNIRYHIVKKRIDKVRVRDTNERLTQPGKIAIVYFNERDVAPYRSVIQELQAQKILLDDLEMLNLEDLQGVSGLKALRVGVTLLQ